VTIDRNETNEMSEIDYERLTNKIIVGRIDTAQEKPGNCKARFIVAGLFYEQVKPTNLRRYTYEEMMAEIDNPRDWPV